MENVYLVQTRWSVDMDSGVYTYIFDSYEKSCIFFNDLIIDEIENTWISDHYSDGKFDEQIDHENINCEKDSNDIVYQKWYVQQRYDWVYYTEISLDVKELQ